jgi:hypothetical protein
MPASVMRTLASARMAWPLSLNVDSIDVYSTELMKLCSTLRAATAWRALKYPAMHQNRTDEGERQLRLPREENVIVNPGRAEPWRYRRYSPCGPGTLTVDQRGIRLLSRENLTFRCASWVLSVDRSRGKVTVERR